MRSNKNGWRCGALIALVSLGACGTGDAADADAETGTSISTAGSSGEAETAATASESSSTSSTTEDSTAGDGDGDGDGDTTTSTGDGDGDGDGDTNWSMTQIVYSGGGVNETVTLDDCQFCDVNDVGTHTLLRYQQDGGWTIWALYIPNSAAPGAIALTGDYNGAYATLSANQASLPSAAQGMYFGDSNVGTLNLTNFDTNAGGLIAGSIDVTMTKGDVSAQLTANFEGHMP